MNTIGIYEMAKLKSKYVEFGTHSFTDFSKSEVGTVANYFLTCDPKSRNEVSKSLTSACHKAGSNCKINTTDLLVKTDELIWKQAHTLRAEITKNKK
jgi:hypothetical protein